MKLFYRGVSYEYTPVTTVSADVTQVDADRKYRGAAHRRGEVAKVERLGAIFKQRDAVNLQPAAPVRAASAAVATPIATANVEHKARLLTLNHDKSLKNRQFSLLTRATAEVGTTFAV